MLNAGPLTLIEDRGRPGFASLGVPPSGAMDRAALGLGNRLVGNAPDAAGLEVLGGGLALRAVGPIWFAVTGAWGDVRVDDRPVSVDRPAYAPDGGVLELALPSFGLRYSVAVRGGIDASATLGSRSSDVLSGLGPAALQDGDVLTLGREPVTPVPTAGEAFTGPPPSGAVRLGLRPGPRTDWFRAASWSALFEQEWRVSPRSNRVGIRLEGTPLERTRADELPSEGMVAGALQVPPNGLPAILGPDHPVTGGYPVIAVVVDRDLDALAQLVPGQPLMFHLVAGRD